MSTIANTSGVRTGTQVFTQAYLSRSVVSGLFKILPILGAMLAIDGNKTGMYGIGNPNVGTLISRIGSAKAREKQIYGAEMYQPLIHSQTNLEGDGAVLPMRGVMPAVGGGGGTGAVITATLGTNPYVTGFAVLNGGSGYALDGSVVATVVGGTTGSAATVTLTITGGVVASAAVNSSGNGYTATPYVTLSSAGVSFDQHFTRPFTKWVERADPILVYKKPQRRAKNLMAGASRGDKEAAIGELYKTAIDDARGVHLGWWAKGMWGVLTSSDTGPSNQGAEVWDNPQSVPAACHTTNVYAGVDRSVAGNTFWNGNRTTVHRAAVLEDLFNEANYTNQCAAIGMGVKVMLCGPSLFPTFMAQARNAGGTILNDGPADWAKFGVKQPIAQFNDMFVICDFTCPDKANIDPRTGSLYTKNGLLAFNPDTFTAAFSPEAKFSVDEPFDLTKTQNGLDALKTQMRTEMLFMCELPKGNQYWEDVG